MSNQLVKRNPVEGYKNVFPKTFIDAINDRESGASLEEIIQGFNMYFLSYNGSVALTRCKVPKAIRKEGLWITYVLYDHTVVTEWYNSDNIDDESWGSDSNWRKASNALVGDISISTDGYWVINGTTTNIKAQGETGITPLLRVGDNNKIQVTYNEGKNWEDISDYIVPKFRWNQGTGTTAGTIQISMDLGNTWKDLSNPITNNLRISKYIGINESLPASGVAEGTVYMKGPYYDENDTNNDNPIYRMWVYAWKSNTLAWQYNGEFTSISAGVVQERGTSTTQVMSQDAVTRELTELESELNIYNPINNFESGYYNLSPAYIGGTLNAVSVAEGGWVRTKLAITKGMRLMLSGLGGGKIITESNEVTEDISTQFISGYYVYSSMDVGAITTPTRTYDGGWRCIAQPVVKGETYTLTGTGGGGARLYCLVNSAGVIKAIAGSGEVQSGLILNVEEDGMLYCSCNKANTFSLVKRYTQTTSTCTNARLYCITNSGGTITHIAEPDFFVDNLLIEVEEDGWLYMNAQISVAYSLACLESKFSVIESNISSIEEQLAELGSSKVLVTEDITAQFISGYYTYSSTDVGANTTSIRNYDGGWKCIAVSVKAGETYIITGTGGGSARLYCLVNSAGVIKRIAGGGEVQSGLEIAVEEEGTLYCSCDANSVFSLVKKYYINASETEGVDSTWKNGSFEFGRTCDCDFTSPTIARWSYPESGQRVAAINAWYDELVSEFPQYVSRESCDDVMASLGVSKPAIISDLPMYIYKFMPPRTPNANGFSTTSSSIKRIKAFIITGTHPEYMGIWDCVNAMRLICRNWKENKNLEELRWNAEIYIIPCYNLYGVNIGQRTNENGVDLNRNAPTSDWKVMGEGTQTYSGPSAGSEYSSKVLKHYLSALKPQVFIDHHNTNVGSGTDEGDGKNMIYTHCVEQIGLDIAGAVISQMTRKWKMRYTDIFPSVEDHPNVLFGYSSFDEIPGSIGKFANEQGSLGSTYESNVGILYKDGIYSTDNRQQNSEVVSTCATEGFINYLVRCLKVYSENIGVQLK